jgi:hypothetical protein
VSPDSKAPRPKRQRRRLQIAPTAAGRRRRSKLTAGTNRGATGPSDVLKPSLPFGRSVGLDSAHPGGSSKPATPKAAQILGRVPCGTVRASLGCPPASPKGPFANLSLFGARQGSSRTATDPAVDTASRAQARRLFSYSPQQSVGCSRLGSKAGRRSWRAKGRARRGPRGLPRRSERPPAPFGGSSWVRGERRVVNSSMDALASG